jgi:hypothetical protein
MLMWRYAMGRHSAFAMICDASRWTGRAASDVAQIYIDGGGIGL